MTALIAGFVEGRCSICDVNVLHAKGKPPHLCPGPKHHPHEYVPVVLRGSESTRESPGRGTARGDSAARADAKKADADAPTPSVSLKKEK